MPIKSPRNLRVKKSFLRKPYLSWTEDPSTTITIKYGSPRTEPDTIFFGQGENLSFMVTTNTGTEKETTLQNLEPATRYNYQIGRQGAVYSFHTAPSGPVPFSFAVYGDYAHLGNKNIKQILYKALHKEDPAFILFTGDLVSNGNFPGAWKREFFSYVKEFSPTVPLMAVPGNHDGGGELFKYYFHYPENRSWYSFYYSNALYIAVNTQARFSPGSLQYRFIEKTLQQANSDWKFVFLHKPPYSTNGGHRSDLKVRAVLCPLFEKYGVDVVFAGHNHAYERTRPIQNNRVDAEKGVVYITTGGGGAILCAFIPFRKLTASEKQWSLIRIKDYHYLQVMVAGKRLEITAKNQWGKIIDQCVKQK